MLVAAGLTLALSAAPTVTVPGLGSAFGNASDTFPGVAVFRGLPYAEPPTGSLRFQPPKPKVTWGNAPLNATWFGNICMQKADPGIAPYTQTQSEDCLYLNVATPAAALADPSSSKLPVMVWVHGGAYMTGCSDDYRTDSVVAASFRRFNKGSGSSSAGAPTRRLPASTTSSLQRPRAARRMRWPSEALGGLGCCGASRE